MSLSMENAVKTKIEIEENEVSITFVPETEVERLCIVELGDEISVSHRHKHLVLRRRHNNIRKISDLGTVGERNA